MSSIPSSNTQSVASAQWLFHWPSVVAGAFVALALFVISVILARACDVDITFRNAASTSGETGAIIWGGVAALICFGIGGLIAGRGAATAGRFNGWLNGLLVWAVAVPVLVYGLGAGVGPRLGQTPELGGGKGPPVHNAMLASAHIGPGAADEAAEPSQPETTGSSTYVSHPQAAAWWMLVSLGLGLVGAAAMGFVSAKTATGARTHVV